jgi:hypothetical protein
MGRTLERDWFRSSTNAVRARYHALVGLGLDQLVGDDLEDDENLESIIDPRL